MPQDVGGPELSPADAGVTRREFLNYAWLASIGVFALQIGGVTYGFALPRLAEGEFGGPVDIGSVDELPGPGEEPLAFSRAKFWWVNTEAGALALYKVCTHLGCIYDWKTDQVKFTCPCHGSQFEKEGGYLLGPAPRGLDTFVIRALDSNGTEVARTDPAGGPLVVPPGSRVIVETGQMIRGQAKA